MRVPSGPSDRSRRRTKTAAALLVSVMMAGSLTPVHAQSAKREDRVAPLPARIAIDPEGVARDARETPAAVAPTLPDVERPDLPQGLQPVRLSLDRMPPGSGISPSDREAIVAAARQRHPAHNSVTIEAMVRRIAAELAFDPAFAATIARIESGFDPFAISDKGAIGVMQLMPDVIREHGLADPFDAEVNVRTGIRHLKGLAQEFRHPVLVAAAYHAGADAVRSARGIPNGPRTAAYVVAVLNGFYDLMAIAGPDASRPAAGRLTASRAPAAASSPGARARVTVRTARAEAATPSNPTGIWERGFVLHLD